MAKREDRRIRNAVFKIREPLNFDFENNKWLYNNKTGKLPEYC